MTLLATCLGLLGVVLVVLAGITTIGMITAHQLTRAEHHHQHQKTEGEST
jgi:hypothetical protein